VATRLGIRETEGSEKKAPDDRSCRARRPARPLAISGCDLDALPAPCDHKWSIPSKKVGAPDAWFGTAHPHSRRRMARKKPRPAPASRSAASATSTAVVPEHAVTGITRTAPRPDDRPAGSRATQPEKA